MMDSTDALMLHDMPKRAAGRRRRHHRPGDGLRVRRARQRGHRGRVLLDQLMPGADPDLVKPLADAAEEARRRGPPEDQGREGRGEEGRPARRRSKARSAPATDDVTTACWWRSAARRTASKIDAEKAGVARRPSAASSRSTGRCAPTCRTSSRSATWSASRCSRTRPRTKASSRRKSPPAQKREWVARVIPSVAYTDPEIAWVGVTETEAKAKGIAVGIGEVPVGRVRPRGRPRPHRRLHQADLRRAQRTAWSAAASSACTPAT